jgi:hypothetical protein
MATVKPEPSNGGIVGTRAAHQRRSPSAKEADDHVRR